MNKKFLSAILFGALMVTSTGTFVSCKDYDDDIDNLQTQIDANASAIAELKALIGDGNYVTSISVSGQNLVVNTKNGSTNVALPECEDNVGSICTISEEGELLIDGKATGIKVAETTEENEFLPAIDIVDGEWVVLQEDGSYLSTGVKVSSVAVTGDEKNGYVLTVTDAEGVETEIKMPTAASLITAIVPATNESADIEVSDVAFTLNGVVAKASDWKGTKELPADGDHVYASATEIDVRINPLSVDATTVPFYLTNTLNADIKPIEMYAVAESSDNALTNTNGRAANLGNGLYTLKVNTVVVKKADYEGASGIKAKFDAAAATATAPGHALAINANHSARSPYQFVVKSVDAPALTILNLEQGSLVSSSYNIGSTNTSTQETYKVGKAITVKATQAAALYDMYLEADASDVEVFGLTFDQVNHTVTVGKNPDVSSVQAYFTLYVTTVANNGVSAKTTIKVNLDPMMNEDEYSLITHDISSTSNVFGIDLATMKTNLGDDLNAWTQNVNLTNVEYALYTDKACSTSANDPTGVFTYEIVKAMNATSATQDRNDANYVRVKIDNSKVAEALSLNTEYYVKVTFKEKTNGKTLNTIVVPVKFVGPALNTFFVVKDGFVAADGAINAYLYGADKKVELDRYFQKYVADAVVNADAETDVYTDANGNKYKSSQLVEQYYTSAHQINASSTNDKKHVEDVWFQLVPGTAKKDKHGTAQLENGYGEALIINITKSNFAGWKYTEDAEKKYTIKFRIMSPILEGSVNPVEGSSITISGNDLVTGAKITDAMIAGYDYNNNKYNVVADKVAAQGTTPDAGATYGLAWANPQVEEVTMGQDADKYIKSFYREGATEKDGAVVNGYFVVKGESISKDVTVNVPFAVKDIWGYNLKQNVSVTIKKN